MSYKTDKYVQDALNGILKESREYKAFELGVASGYFNLYKHCKNESGETLTNKWFDSIIKGTDNCSNYFRKLIEVDNEIEPSKETSEMIERIRSARERKTISNN